MGTSPEKISKGNLCREVAVIFVAVGTTNFDSLLQRMDELCASLAEEVIMQTGRSGYKPQNCEHFKFAPSLAPYYEKASLVVSHGGLGIVTEVMERQRPLVAVEDPDQPDQHQREILTVWEQEGHLIWCKDLQKLAEAIQQATTQLKPYTAPPCTIHTIIADYLNKLK